MKAGQFYVLASLDCYFPASTGFCSNHPGIQSHFVILPKTVASECRGNTASSYWKHLLVKWCNLKTPDLGHPCLTLKVEKGKATQFADYASTGRQPEKANLVNSVNQVSQGSHV